MVTISVLMRFIQEFRSNRTVAELRALVGTTVTVLRVSVKGQSRRQEIPLREVCRAISSFERRRYDPGRCADVVDPGPYLLASLF